MPTAQSWRRPTVASGIRFISAFLGWGVGLPDVRGLYESIPNPDGDRRRLPGWVRSRPQFIDYPTVHADAAYCVGRG